MTPGSPGADSMAADPIKSKLLPFFTTALKAYQQSSKTFAVLCSLPASSSLSSTSSSPPPHISSGVQTASDSNPLETPKPIPPRVTPRSILVLDSSFNPPTVAHQRMVLSALSDDDNDKNRIEKGSSQLLTQPPRVLLLLAINNADKAPKPASFPQRLAMMYILAEDLLSRSSRGAAVEEGMKGGGGEEAAGSGSVDRGSITCSGVDIAVTTEPYFHSKSAAIQDSGFYHQNGHHQDGKIEHPHSQSRPQQQSTAAPSPSEQTYLTGFDTLIRIFNSKYYSSSGRPGGSAEQAMAAALDPFFAHSSLRVTMRTDADWGTADDQRAYLEELRKGGGKTAGWADKIEMVEGGRRDGEEVISSTKVRDAVRRRDWDRLKALVSDPVAEWVREQRLYEEEKDF